MKKKYVLFMTCLMAIVCAANISFAQSSTSNPNIRTTLLRYDPFPVGPGNYVTLFVQVANTGGKDASNVRLKIVPSYPFSVDTNSSVTLDNSALPIQLTSDNVAVIGPLASLQNAIVKYKLRVDQTVFEGNYQISVWCQPQFSDSWTISDFNLLVQGKDKLVIDNLTPSTITPGRPTDVVFTLDNKGTATLHDITLAWSEQDNNILPLGSENKRYITSIDPGTTLEVPFTVVADPTVTSGVYNLNINLNYTVGVNTTKSTNSNIGIFVGGMADFDVSVQQYSGQSITFSVANIGSNPTTSVSIAVPEQPAYVTSGTSSSFLGSLGPGDFTLATFTLVQRGVNNTTGTGRNNAGGSPPAGAPGAFNISRSGQLKLEIAYTDTNGVRRIVEKSINLQSSVASSTATGLQSGQFQRTDNSGNFFLYGVAAIVIVVVLFVFRKKITAKIRCKNKMQK
jgi:hypothetical protein